jgi:MFS transporter, DHA1 family, multidrug resistance protein
MTDLLRDAPVGQLIRWISKGRILQYPEEKAGFECPSSYQRGAEKSFSADTTPGPTSSFAEKKDVNQLPDLTTTETAVDGERVLPGESGVGHEQTLSKILTRPNMSRVATRADLEQAYTNATRQQSVRQEQSRPIVPEQTADGIVLVDWYTTDDPENPQNWSNRKKALVVLQIYLYTLAVYMGSAI